MSRLLQILKKPKLFKLLIGHLLRITGLCKYFKIRYNGFWVRFNPTAYSLNLWVYQEANSEDIDFIQSYLKAGDTFLDIGANIGILTLTASKHVGNTGHVYAVEAHPQTFEYLANNIKLNQYTNVTTYHTALGKEKGTLLFTSNARLDDQNRVSTDINDANIQVPLNKLDNLISPDRIHLLKIDVEGFEAEVFKGAEQALGHTDCIYFESWEQHLQQYGCSTPQVISYLNQLGFEVFKYHHTGNRITKLSASYISHTCENLIAVKKVDELIKRTQLSIV